VPLRYRAGPDPRLDRPGHVRAASALVRVGRMLVVVQDDALFLGAFGRGPSLERDAVEALTLPSPDGVRLFDDGRGNKADKADLEAACTWPTPGGPALVAFGSGSTPRRERLLVASAAGDGLGEPGFVEAPSLYARLRESLPEGVELNVEGAFRTADGRLRLLQRGNGRGGVDAVLDVDGAWLDGLLAVPTREVPPRLLASARWSLGALDGVRLTFTDGAPLAGRHWLFTASAEASPDAVADGPVVGSAVGWADEDGGAWAPVTDDRGEIVPCKLEGLALGRPGERGREAWGVVDADDPDAPSDLLRLQLEGPWPPSGPGSAAEAER
jgi:hypothetical protein